jgi:hypothetical protein
MSGLLYPLAGKIASALPMRRKFFLLTILICSLFSASWAQQKRDSVPSKSFYKRLRDNKMAQKLIQNLKRKEQDTIFNVKSEDPYLKYEGKIIRKITIERIGFEKNILDTTHTIFSRVAHAGNKLHNTTKEWVIRDNLFIRSGKPLNSYRIADNERYLRDLDFILDSRIFVKPIPNSPDSIDLRVVTRDVFSAGASFNPYSFSNYKYQVQEANLGGMGQRLQYSGVFNNLRDPHFGSDILYRKTNMFGTFINGSLEYTSINTTSIYGREDEKSLSFVLARPLFMPYTRWAGGVTLSRNKSANVLNKPDSVYQNYRYNIQDYWVGYTFGQHKKFKEIRENRNRKFVAIRAFDQQYLQVPYIQLNQFDKLLYNNRTSVLGQVTFFRQDFYKTRYVLGFGRTEDIPYGYRFSFTSGFEKEQGRQRPYAGADIYRNIVNKNGSFLIYELMLASYYKNGRSEDALFSFNLTSYTKIIKVGEYKIRHQLDVGYAQQFNQLEKRPLDINNTNGIILFEPDSLLGNRRINIRSQTVLFTPWKLGGFNIAPLFRLEGAYLSQLHETVFEKKNFFSSISGGFRVRNENLIFNTIEARAIYYPRTIDGISHIGFNVQANLKIKYPTILVTAPATVYN